MTDSALNTQLEEGLARLAAGEYRAVHADCIELIKRNPLNAVPFFLLGQLSADHRNFNKAHELFSKAHQLAPTNGYCAVYCAQCLTQLGHQAEAKKQADRAAELKLSTAHLCDTLGVVYSRTGFHEKAVGLFEKAVELNPKPANYHYNLAASLQFLGKFVEAEASYQAVLTREPNDYRAMTSMVSLKKQTSDSNQLSTLLKQFEKHREDVNASLHLGHALAKTYEDLGDYQTSLHWLHKAKAGKLSEGRVFDFAPIFAAAKRTAQCQSVETQTSEESPIFIVGLPRTGTTLVDRIISSHPEVVAAGELNTFAGLVKQAVKTPSNLMLDAATLLDARQTDLANIGHDYIESTTDLRRNASRFTDKMPLNFFYAGLIHQALPNAKIVALRRGAMDSCVSNYRQLLTTDHSYYNYTYSLNETAKFYRGFDDLMSHWRQSLPTTAFIEVYYEDIVHDQETQTRKLLQFCGLEWDRRCLNFHQNTAPVSTASSVQVRQPLYSGSIGRWQRYGDQLEELRAALGDLVD